MATAWSYSSLMKTTRTTEAKRANDIRVLENVVAMLDANLKGAQGSEAERLQGELDGVREQLRLLEQAQAA